jgi:hypothetical protein
MDFIIGSGLGEMMESRLPRREERDGSDGGSRSVLAKRQSGIDPRIVNSTSRGMLRGTTVRAETMESERTEK